MAHGVNTRLDTYGYLSGMFMTVPNTPAVIKWLLSPIAYDDQISYGQAVYWNTEWSNFEVQHWGRREDGLYRPWVEANRGHFMKFIVHHCLAAVGLPETILGLGMNRLRHVFFESCLVQLQVSTVRWSYQEFVNNGCKEMTAIVCKRIEELHALAAQYVTKDA